MTTAQLDSPAAAAAGGDVPPLAATAPPSDQAEGAPEEQLSLAQVGVVGVPNAGKSTLVNSLVGTKVGEEGVGYAEFAAFVVVKRRLASPAGCSAVQVSAVSAKTNTTARIRLGAFTEGAAQVVLYDTPGVVGPR
jgi:GTP-binding protein Era